MTDKEHNLWILTVLTVNDTDACRRAFISGYNGKILKQPRTIAKKASYEWGKQVSATLNCSQEREN